MFYGVGLVVIMTAISIAANSRLRKHDRLPMQWSISGNVNWSAPRIVALSFYPGLAAIMVLVLSFLSERVPLHPKAAYSIPLLVMLLLVIQCLWIWGAMRTLRSR